MQFAIICIGSLLALGVIAAIASMLSKGGTDAPVADAHECSSCSSMASGECKLGCLIEENRQRAKAKEGLQQP